MIGGLIYDVFTLSKCIGGLPKLQENEKLLEVMMQQKITSDSVSIRNAYRSRRLTSLLHYHYDCIYGFFRGLYLCYICIPMKTVLGTKKHKRPFEKCD